MTSSQPEQWRIDRDATLNRLTETATRLFAGRTVASVAALAHVDDADCTNLLRFTLDDGTTIDLVGGYSGYSGYACDEYTEQIKIHHDGQWTA